MSIPIIECVFCNEPVDTQAVGNYRKVIGWAETRRKGGANHITLASEPLGWAHGWCLDTIKRRGYVSQGQGPLF